jgi:DNA-binding transcriptional regulator LsrR (DeoR family)
VNAPEDRLRRLEHVARLYYEQDMNQADIAELIGVSRPFVSRLLAEAKDEGIVEIKIHSLLAGSAVGRTLGEVISRLGVRGGQLVPEFPDDEMNNDQLAAEALALIDHLGGGRLGLGWGHVIGAMITRLEAQEPVKGKVTDVCPLIGNRSVPIRHYHSNENMRIFAQQTLATPHFLHTPSLVETRRDLELVKQTESYQSILREWGQLDIALVNIGNHPSTPDFATQARFGNLLSQMRVIGRMVAYYYNMVGHFAYSDHDYVLQVPMEELQRCPVVIGVCSANTSWQAILGALNTGLITHLVAREQTVATALEHASDSP